MKPASNQLALMITRRCNMTCAHCSVESAPGVRGEPDETTLLAWVRDAAKAGVRAILFTGGEPMLREKILLRLMKECQRLGVRPIIGTNGSWGKNLDAARRKLRALKDAGLTLLTVSYDRYHAEFQGHEPALNIARAAEELRVPLNINLTRGVDEQDLEPLAAPFGQGKWARLRFYDVQPVGRARQFATGSLRGATDGFCSACERPAITEDGRVVACNGPSYFAKPGSPLHVGSLREEPLAALLQRHYGDSILDTIRTGGPSRLREELRSVPGFEDFFRESYAGICDLCLHINSSPRAVAALRGRLDEPARVADRLAIAQIIRVHRRGGPMEVEHVNSIGAARIFFRAAFERDRWGIGTSKLLGRADLDWHRLAHYLASCGLAHPLLGALHDPPLTRWAPAFFLERLRTAGLASSTKELLARKTLRTIADALRELGATGVLLKGAARTAWNAEKNLDGYAPGDIDLYVAPEFTGRLRAKLIELGFSGKSDSPQTSPQHFPPLKFRGLAIEIHTRILHPHWRLPETEMLAAAIPVPGWEPLKMLSPEGFLLHSAVHGTSHLFSFGLKLGASLQWVLREFPVIDWPRLLRWIDASAVPRAFWTPVRVLTEALALPFPAEFLAHAPEDERQRKLDVIARALLFKSLDAAHEANPFAQHGLNLFLRDSLPSRAAYLADFARRKAQRPLRSRHAYMPGRSLPRIDEHFRAAWHHWRAYRRASACRAVPSA